MADPARSGVLLINLGTPDSPAVGDVRRYLREFLSDPRVIDIHPVARFALVHGAIAPLRGPRSAAQYRSIWGPDGSPLLVHGRALERALAAELGDRYVVRLGMRYQRPPLTASLRELLGAGVSRILALPLFPQYASSSTGSALQRLLEAAAGEWNVPTIEVLGEFYDEPGFVSALADVTRPVLERAAPDHLLMSYHGLPERQVRKSAPDSERCLSDPACCASIRPDNARCYRAQCHATSRALARELELDDGRWSVSFQSRLGRTPWIQPFTDEVLPRLAAAGVRRLAVVCPSFTADCLETVEEIGIRAREQWAGLGGESLEQVPCVNAHPTWVRSIAERVRGRVE